ncbi:MAG TPA: non-canonical purine NTP pyrophosphatase, partial [Pusillimonas sp.]|nr:non-canonical purine NTP pyrophosphatase [Pusillimonas sp.]
EDRRAHYVAVLVFMRSANDPQPVIAQARWHGEIISEPMGSHGFGYDPYFYLPQFEKTVAQLDPAEKN